MSGEAIQLKWTTPGPVAQAFMRDRSFVRGIMGPIGSGKTTACIMNIITMARQQERAPDGKRYFKCGVVRDTYRNLMKTTVPSWWKWIPRDQGRWVGGGAGDPAVHELLFKLGHDDYLHLIVEFIALGSHAAEDVMRGWEGTMAWLNEADRLVPEALTYIKSRMWRYPAGVLGKPSWCGVILDFNAPDTDNYLYDLFVDNKPDNHEFFEQPGGLEPGAENHANLEPSGPEYYRGQMAGQPQWFINRFIHNRWGYSREGLPVYPEYADRKVVAADPFGPAPMYPIGIGVDAGRTPAAILTQRTLDGQLRVFDEVIPDVRLGAKQFGEMVRRRLDDWALKIKDRHRMPAAFARCDPAASYPSDTDDDAVWMEIFGQAADLPVEAAPTNQLTPRLEAVRQLLLNDAGADRPGLILSPKCKVLRKGFNYGYRYKKRQGAELNHDLKPEKNAYSHPHDGLQYIALDESTYLQFTGRSRHRRAGPPIEETSHEPLSHF